MRKGITIFSKRQIRERMDMYFNIHTIIIMWVIDYTIEIVFGRLAQDGVSLCLHLALRLGVLQHKGVPHLAKRLRIQH